jgi:MoaA/NifB/PqqE/SkfB family radical SAM enzyme
MYALGEIAADAPAFYTAVSKGQPYQPLYVKMKLVWDCNLRCGMCNHWRSKREPPLDIVRLETIVDELVALGSRKIHLSGGEPTLHSDLEALIAYMSEHGLRVTMTTNATLITRERGRSLAEAGLRGVNISLDSPEPRLHDRIRGVKGAWKRAIKGFRYLRRRMKKGKVRVNTVVGRLNYASLVDLPELVAELGADMLNLIPLDDHTGELQRLSKRQIKDYNEHIAPVIAEKSLALGLMPDARQAYPFGQTSREINLSRNGFYAQGFYDRCPCFAPWTHAMIDHVGRVSVCCMLREGPIMGDLRQQSFAEVWAGANYAALRASQTLPLFPACRRCDDFLGENRQLLAALSQPPAGSKPAGGSEPAEG